VGNEGNDKWLFGPHQPKEELGTKKRESRERRQNELMQSKKAKTMLIGGLSVTNDGGKGLPGKGMKVGGGGGGKKKRDGLQRGMGGVGEKRKLSKTLSPRFIGQPPKGGKGRGVGGGGGW